MVQLLLPLAIKLITMYLQSKAEKDAKWKQKLIEWDKWVKTINADMTSAADISASEETQLETLQQQEEQAADSSYTAWLDKALEITGQFEGTGYGQVTGNFDQQGLSCGILQWCIGQGSLQKEIIFNYLSASKKDIFNLGLEEIMALSPKDAITYVVNRTNTESDYKSRWSKFMLTPEVVDLQKKAANSLGSKALQLCKDHNMMTCKSFCWFFDILTQNGSLKGVAKPTGSREEYLDLFNKFAKNNAVRWKSLATEETRILYIWTCKRAALARAEYQDDVRARKGTIAHGCGEVHGKFSVFFP